MSDKREVMPIDANALLDDMQELLNQEVLGNTISDVGVGIEIAMDRIKRAKETTLNTLRDAIYEDAVKHGLWEDEDGIDWYQESHSMIECEVDELYDAIEDRVNGHGDEHFTEELADVIIASLSVAGKLGIDIDAAVRRKMEINKGRTWKHGKDEKK